MTETVEYSGFWIERPKILLNKPNIGEPDTQSNKNQAVMPHCKKDSRPHIQAHLVFADTQSQNEKPKELEFLPKFDK
ncbi:MAG: hypothetical protein IPJ51_21610 [Saprospiraceae bacterium]|nr:hypothetical protein [Saprospiraceae bacterium]